MRCVHHVDSWREAKEKERTFFLLISYCSRACLKTLLQTAGGRKTRNRFSGTGFKEA